MLGVVLLFWSRLEPLVLGAVLLSWSTLEPLVLGFIVGLVWLLATPELELLY